MSVITIASFPSVKFCDICDNSTPQVWVEDFGQSCCQLCFEAYGECN